jgi:hypothetical protein
MMNKNAIIIAVVTFGFATLIFGFKNVDDKPVQQPQFEWNQITVIESVVSGGLGRSRMISTNDKGEMEQEKLQNFFSMTGINFGNVQENDLKITNMVSKMSAEGWLLYNVTSGVYAADKSTGIFITRYLFKRII